MRKQKAQMKMEEGALMPETTDRKVRGTKVKGAPASDLGLTGGIGL
jgi:hypothetical protein